MGFKLGKGRGLDVRNGAVGNKMRFNSDATTVPGVDIIRKDLGEGIMGEANMDGSIYISNLVEPGSAEYEDFHVEYNGRKYEREEIDGEDMINYEDKWIKAGSMELPWELEANNGNK